MDNYYGMFSDEGNEAVHQIVQRGLLENRAWLEVYQDLVRLAESDRDRFGEATDTTVRDMAYEALGRFNENFYVTL
jgi:hypothetical protein